MSCPSAVFTVNTNVVVPDGGAQVPLGSIVRRYGKSCQLNGGGINLMGSGYYDLDCSMTFSPTAAGAVTVQFLQDGLAIPGAVATAYGTAAEPANLSVSALLRNCGCDCNTTITATVSAAGTVDIISTRVEKK